MRPDPTPPIALRAVVVLALAIVATPASEARPSPVRSGDAPHSSAPVLEAPYLWGGTRLVERNNEEVSFNPLRGARAYRIQISVHEDFRHIVYERRVEQAIFRIEGLSDGDYYVRARGIDANGVEGNEAVARMVMRARPEAPRVFGPPSGSAQRGDALEISWQPVPGAIAYVVQLSGNDGFRGALRDWSDIRGTTHVTRGIPPGRYWWRVGSVHEAGVRGHFSEPRAIELRALPSPPATPKIDGDALLLSWNAEPGQRFEVEVASDDNFRQVVYRAQTSASSLHTPRPEPGTYYLRLRATDADGAIGPYAPIVAFKVPRREPKPHCVVEGPGGLCVTYAPRGGTPAETR